MALTLEKYLDPVEPVEQVPEYTYEDIDLGGVSWNYRLLWNDRSERWQIYVWSSDGTKEINGVKVVPNYPLMWAQTGRRPENGYIYLLDTGDDDGRDQCTYEGLGHRWKLCWLDDDGVAAAEDRPWSITVP
jgi:hypothetical protein